jgi:tetraacyldisaccharide-1-P 4'-kinase
MSAVMAFSPTDLSHQSNLKLFPHEPRISIPAGYKRADVSGGLLRTMRLNHPVVSVGTTLGGMGKTPLVIALAERFRDEGSRPVILSRGYKRSSKGIVVVAARARS